MTGSDGPGPPRVLRLVGRLLLLLHPEWFRREHGPEYREAVAHRWRLERRRGAGATWRAVWVLLADAVTAVPELRREARRSRWDADAGLGATVEGVWRDLRLGVRSLGRRPGFATLVVLTLGAGIGAHAALFGVLDRFLLRPLPFEGGDRMGFVTLRSTQTGFRSSPIQELLERWREGAATLEGIGGCSAARSP